MRKFIGLILILALLWLAKLSYDSYLLSQRFDLLQQNITQMEQNNANLNDHLVALQRQFTNPADQSSTASEPAPSAAIHTALNPVILVKQQLEDFIAQSEMDKIRVARGLSDEEIEKATYAFSSWQVGE